MISFEALTYARDLVEREEKALSAEMLEAIKDGCPEGEIMVKVEKYRKAFNARTEMQKYLYQNEEV